MASDKRLGTKLPSWTDRDKTAGMKFDTAPYVGVVKNNIDPTRSGRLQVWIPDLGGEETNTQNWRTVSYASPFFGATYQPEASKNNKFDQVQHTYGMWAVPPDIGNEVLCIFVNGDPGRGYWFACVNSHLSHNMVPAIGTLDKTLIDEASYDTGNELVKNSLAQQTKPTLPVAEFNENDEKNMADTFMQNKRTIHEFQANVLINQGLDKDPIRGAITSSSQRETPSQVFGISTPGRPIKDPADDPNYIKKLSANEIDEKDYAVRGRKGGHTFVMDDGDVATGADQLMRLRTAGGHQILMNDTERVMYIANSEGSVWMEFSGTGQINVYAGGGVNVRTDGDFNFHADGNMNLHAGGTFNLKALRGINLDTNAMVLKASEKLTAFGGKVGIGSAGMLELSGASGTTLQSDGKMAFVGSKIDLNNGGAAAVGDPGSLKALQHNDTSRESAVHPWVTASKTLTSIVTVAPSHEPWPRQSGDGKMINDGPAPSKTIAPVDCTPKPGTNAVGTGSGGTLTDGSGNPVTTGADDTSLDPGPRKAKGQAVKNPCPVEQLSKPDAPNPSGGIGPLNTNHTKALMSALAWKESAWKYSIENQIGYLGRYQFGAPALVECGYIKRDYYTKTPSNSVCKQDAAWTGKDGCSSKNDWFNCKSGQEGAMYALLQKNYSTLSKIGGVKSDDDLCTVAGMLAVAHLLGAGGAKTWRMSASGSDANGTTGEMYFNIGRYAIDVLSPAATGGTGAGAADVNINEDDVFTWTARSGDKAHWAMTTTAFKNAMLQAANEYKKATGRKIVVSSSVRTQTEQSAIYDGWVNAGGKLPGNPTVNVPGYGNISRPVKTVGNHGGGIAMDTSQAGEMESMGILAKYGLWRFDPTGDPVHIQPKKV